MPSASAIAVAFGHSVEPVTIRPSASVLEPWWCRSITTSTPAAPPAASYALRAASASGDRVVALPDGDRPGVRVVARVADQVGPCDALRVRRPSGVVRSVARIAAPLGSRSGRAGGLPKSRRSRGSRPTHPARRGRDRSWRQTGRRRPHAYAAPAWQPVRCWRRRGPSATLRRGGERVVGAYAQRERRGHNGSGRSSSAHWIVPRGCASGAPRTIFTAALTA
jgi:hypothetical protein